ncbi:MAG: hypothetical protein HYX27_26035 [Acidobacteria bacterium]|nr:hypothetical protein [Acidobacteriota bacterium]
MTFEQGFAEAERAADAAGKVTGVLTGAVKQLSKAASEGDLLKMRKASERLATIVESARQEVLNARSAWPFSPEEEEVYLRDSFADEVIRAANADNLPIQRQDEGLIVFPSILRVAPAERAVKINRRKVQAIRPSRVVKTLRDIQARKQKGTPEQLLETLYRAYRLVTGSEYGKTVTLSSIYDALTILPGSTASYDHTDFVRDLFLLDRSGVTRTKSGATYSLPASTGTKGKKASYTFVAPDGETISYYGIRFVEEPA